MRLIKIDSPHQDQNSYGIQSKTRNKTQKLQKKIYSEGAEDCQENGNETIA